MGQTRSSSSKRKHFEDVCEIGWLDWLLQNVIGRDVIDPCFEARTVPAGREYGAHLRVIAMAGGEDFDPVTFPFECEIEQHDIGRILSQSKEGVCDIRCLPSDFITGRLADFLEQKGQNLVVLDDGDAWQNMIRQCGVWQSATPRKLSGMSLAD